MDLEVVVKELLAREIRLSTQASDLFDVRVCLSGHDEMVMLVLEENDIARHEAISYLNMICPQTSHLV